MAANFDRLARPYRWLEYFSFGPFLKRCRNTFLPDLAFARHALVLGDGDGRFLKRLLGENPRLTADVVDSSRSMLRVLENRLALSRRRIQVHHSDALAWRPTGSYDLIVCHFFLDCLFPEQMETLLDSLLPHVQPGARWVISEFSIPAHPIVRWLATALVALLYRIFGMLTGLRVRQLPDYTDALRSRGLVLLKQRTWLGGLLCAQLWSVSV